MFRLDRFLTLYFFYPLLKRRRSAAEPKIPILMYHSISDGIENGIHPYYRLNTSTRRFAQHMKFLCDNNYRVISLSEAANLLNQPIDNQPINHVVLTFDDGYQDFITKAWPILNEYGQTATVFLPTGYIGEKRKLFKGKKCLTWSEVRELRNCGINFGSHTVTHPVLNRLDWDEIHKELRDSRLQIENELQEPTLYFSYPYAFSQENLKFVRRFKNELVDQGYHAAVTTAIGRARMESDPFCLKRLPINESDDAMLFEAKLIGAYDWLAIVQAIIRNTKKFLRNESRGGR